MPEDLERRLGADRRPPLRVVGQVLGADESPPAVAQVDEHPDAGARRDRHDPARYPAAERKPLQGGVSVFRLDHACAEPFHPLISRSAYVGHPGENDQDSLWIPSASRRTAEARVPIRKTFPADSPRGCPRTLS